MQHYRLGVDEFATHRLGIKDAPVAYDAFQKKQDGAVKVTLDPWNGTKGLGK